MASRQSVWGRALSDTTRIVTSSGWLWLASLLLTPVCGAIGLNRISEVARVPITPPLDAAWDHGMAGSAVLVVLGASIFLTQLARAPLRIANEEPSPPTDDFSLTMGRLRSKTLEAGKHTFEAAWALNELRQPLMGLGTKVQAMPVSVPGLPSVNISPREWQAVLEQLDALGVVETVTYPLRQNLGTEVRWKATALGKRALRELEDHPASQPLVISDSGSPEQPDTEG